MTNVMTWATLALCFIIPLLAAEIMGFFSWKNHFDVNGKTVIITGGSQGMGRGLGKLLAQKGANVVIVARTQSKLDEAIKYISAAAKTPTQRFLAISADVTQREENTRIIAEVTAWNNNTPPDIVWANAGAAHPSLFIDTDLDIMRDQMDLNYWAAAYLAHATLKSWLKPASSTPLSITDGTPGQPTATSATSTPPRHFIATSSVACFVGLAGYAPYSPAKAALRSLIDDLRSEVNLYNGHRRSFPRTGPAADIQVHCVMPGTILSPGLDNENKTKHAVTKLLEEGDGVQTEDEVAKAAVRALEGGEFLITTQWLGGFMKAGMLGDSPRGNVFLDTLSSWVVAVVWLFIRPDMDGKVYNWGRRNKVQLPQ